MAATGNRIMGVGYPGPGSYDAKSTNEKLSYSIRVKTLNPCTKFTLFLMIIR
jgi:hypothetical protein